MLFKRKLPSGARTALTVVLVLLMTICAVAFGWGKVRRAPGGVPKPTIPTLGRVIIKLQISRQGTAHDDQFALWLEDGQGICLKTLAVTDYAAIRKVYSDPFILPLWHRRSQIENYGGMRFKDVNAMVIDTPQDGIQEYIWYCDNDAATRPMEAGNYQYFLESTVGKERHLVFAGSITIGKGASQSDGHVIEGELNDMVLTPWIKAEYIPGPREAELAGELETMRSKTHALPYDRRE